MEVTMVAPNVIKIKSKYASFIVDPLVSPDGKSVKGMTKTAADCVLLMSGTQRDVDSSKLEGIRLVVAGPGDYEVGGVKLSSFLTNSSLSYHLRVDSGEVALVRADGLKSLGDRIKECPTVVIQANTVPDVSHITAFSPQVLVIYGEKAEELVKALENDAVKKTSKVQVFPDKMPQEMEVYLLQ